MAADKEAFGLSRVHMYQARIQLLAKGVVVIMTCRTWHKHQKRSTLADDVRG